MEKKLLALIILVPSIFISLLLGGIWWANGVQSALNFIILSMRLVGVFQSAMPEILKLLAIFFALFPMVMMTWRKDGRYMPMANSENMLFIAIISQVLLLLAFGDTMLEAKAFMVRPLVLLVALSLSFYLFQKKQKDRQVKDAGVNQEIRKKQEEINSLEDEIEKLQSKKHVEGNMTLKIIIGVFLNIALILFLFL